MKTILFTIILLVLSNLLYSQTIIFHEDFELPSAGDSVTSVGMPIWTINNMLYSEGNRSYRDSVGGSLDTAYLVTNSFSTLGVNIVILTFDHICKIEFTDKGEIEVSIDNGVSWTKLTSFQYQGSGQFPNIGNCFNSTAYPLDWDPSYNSTIPTNTWWKSEVFNIGAIVGNHSNVKVRFKLSNGPNGIPGNNGTYGWLIDNIKVTILEPPIDATLDSIISPQSTIPYGTSTAVKVVIKNTGTTALTSFPLSYSINHSGFVFETWNGNLLPDDTIIYTFSSIYTPPIGTNSFFLKTWVNVTTDMNPQNDTNYRTVYVGLPLWDVSMTHFDSLPSQICQYSSKQISAYIKNLGANTLSNLTVKMFINNVLYNSTVVAGPLYSGDSAQVNFNFFAIAAGTFQICLKVDLANDVDTLNNFICQNAVVVTCPGINHIWQTNFSLSQNIPNPSKSNTQIEFELPVSGLLNFRLMNSLGQILKSEAKEYTSGKHLITIDVSKLPAGIYYYSIEMDGRQLMKKMIIE